MIDAKVWATDSKDQSIYRNVVVDGKNLEEWLATSDPRFNDFKCIHNDDLFRLIEAATRSD